MSLSLSGQLANRRVEAVDDRSRRATILTESCSWCGGTIDTSILDEQLVAVRGDLRPAVVAALLSGRVVHLSAERCADAGHDPGDEDPDQAVARLAWHPAAGEHGAKP